MSKAIFKVSVLMSTFNGEKYLMSQIDSILQQKDIEVDLIIRDDGSTDKTFCHLQQYESDNSNISVICGQNKGFIGSFSELTAISYFKSNSDYYAFVDQDDVWYPEKLQVACKKLSEYPENIPNLFCSNSDIIDFKGSRTGKRFRDYTPKYTRGNVLMFPLLQGCSMVFNRKALELYYENQPRTSYHDRWMYLICHFLGNVIYEPKPLFGYRVHDRNALGPKKEYDFLTQSKRLCNMLFTSQESEYFKMNEEFYDAFLEKLQEKDKILIKKYLSYKSNLHSKMYVLFSKQYGCPIPSVRENLLYIPHVLLNKM